MPIDGASRSVAAGVEIRVALASTRGKLFPLRRSDSRRSVELKMICPVCAAEGKGQPLEQFYLGSCGHKPDDSAGYKTGACAKGRQLDDKSIVPLSDEEVASLKVSELPEKVLELQFCPAEQILAQTRPGPTSYWFEPERTDAFYGILASDLAENPDNAAWGVMLLAGNEKAFRLEPFNGGLVLQELIRPQELVTVTALDAPYKETERAMFGQLVGALMDRFDPDALRSTKADKLAAIVAEKTGGTSVPAQKPAVTTQADLETMLAAAIEAAKKKGA